jgi:hypothetical protein
MTEKFFLKIDAESPDGEAVRCETTVKIACSSEMAISIISNLMKKDSSLKEIFTKALLFSLTDSIETEKISDEEYEKRSSSNHDEDIEL